MGSDGADSSTEVVWDEVPLSELTSANVTYGVIQPGAAVSDGVPMIRVNNFSGHTLNLVDVMRISHAVERKYERTRLRADDVLITVVGSVGQVAIVPLELAGWNIARAVALIRPRSTALARWIAHFLRSPIAQHRVGVAANTTVQTTVNLKDLRAMRIPMPPEPTRRGISELLGALDDRIDLLRQTNVTLEAIAQALFKSWFVDFDPVHAKAEGRDPEVMDAATAALFPSEFEESELGLIPKEWSSLPVYDLAQFINGAAYKAFDPNREKRGLPIIKIAELKAGVTEQTAYSDVEMPDKYRIDTGDILFSWSGNPDTSIDTFVWSSGSAWLNQHIFRVVPSSTGERSFVLLALKYLKPTFTGIARNKQTTGLGHVTVSDLKRLQITKPDEAVLQRWNLLVDPLVERAFAVQQQAQTLIELRDTLLPPSDLRQAAPARSHGSRRGSSRMTMLAPHYQKHGLRLRAGLHDLL